MKYALNITIAGLVFIIISLGVSFAHRLFVAEPISPELESWVVRETVEETIQINVLNGCGVNGLAGKTKLYLRTRGFDVVDIGNAEHSVARSYVIDRLGDRRSAQMVARAMGIQDTLVVTNIDSSLFVRTSVILGQDFQQLKPFH